MWAPTNCRHKWPYAQRVYATTSNNIKKSQSESAAVRAQCCSKDQRWPTALSKHQHDACQLSLALCRWTHQVQTSDSDVPLFQALTPRYLSTNFIRVADAPSHRRLQQMVSLFGHCDSSPSAIMHFQWQAVTCRTVFLTNSLHWVLLFFLASTQNVFVLLIISRLTQSRWMPRWLWLLQYLQS